MTTLVLKKTFAALPQAERARPVRITGDPKNGTNILYCNGNSVFIRNMEDPTIVDIYTEHSKNTTAARYSPSGFYIASGDITGKVRIWDTVNKEHKLKAEYTVLGGAIHDLDWSPDSERIVVCGNGREKFCHVFKMDTGTSVGNIGTGGHTKMVNSCSFRPTRPFHIVTASEDFHVGFFKGPPFESGVTKACHGNFTNVVRFSHDGKTVISGGSDGKLCKFEFDGKDFKQAEQFIEGKAHNGGIYEVCFSPDDKQLLTASGDKTARVFDVQTGNVLQTFKVSDKSWQDMHVGCLWQKNELITVNAIGHIIYHDMENPTKPKRIIKGHMKPVTAMALSADKSTVFTGGLEGIIHWDVNTGDNDNVAGAGHTNQVTDMVVDGDKLISVGVDDVVRFSSVSSREFCGGEIKLDSQPRGVDARNGVVVVASDKHLTVIEGNHKTVLPVKSEARCVSIHPGGSSVAVGFGDSKVRVYSLQSGALSEVSEVQVKAAVSALAYSPDGTYLVVASDRRVSVLSVTDYKELSKNETHSARVVCVAWASDSTRFATGALDNRVVLFEDVNESYDTKPSIKAHTMSHANKIAWIDEETLITAGHDANVKQFSIIVGAKGKGQNTKK